MRRAGSSTTTSAPGADRHLRGIRAHHAGADDDDFGRGHARHAAEQHAAAALRFLQACAPAWIDMRPATSDIGASSGKPPRRR